MSLIHRGRHTPHTTIRRGRVCTLQSTVNKKLDSRHANIIIGSCRDRYVRLPRHDSAVRGRRDRDRRWSGVATAAGEADPVNGAVATREVIEKTIGRHLQVNRQRNTRRKVRNGISGCRIKSSYPATTEVSKEIVADKLRRKLRYLRIVERAAGDGAG